MMPTAADLDDPLGFAQGEAGSMSDEDFDAAIGQLLDGDDERPPGGGSGPRAEDSTDE